MKIKFYRTDSVYYLILTVIVLNIGILRIFGWEIFNRNYPFRYLTCVLIYLMLLIKLPNITNYWKISLAFILSVMFCELIFSKVYYDESMVNIFKQNTHVWYYLILIPLLGIDNQKKRENIFKFIIVLTVSTLLMKSFSWYMVNVRQSIVFENFLTEFGTEWIRKGLYRYNSTPFGSMTFLLISYKLITEKKGRILSLILLTFIIWYDVKVYQSRAESVICILGFSSIYLLYRRKDMDRSLVKYVSVIICIASVLLSGVLRDFLQTFNIGTSLGGTTRLRLEAIRYYYPYFKRNMLMGIGFLDNSMDSTLKILRGTSGNRYLDDLGVLGYIFQFGLFGVAIVTIIIWRMLKIFHQIQENKARSLLGGLLALFILMSVMSSCPFDSQRMIVVPFFLVIFEWVFKNDMENWKLRG